jgi:DNA-binding HxlR family transcriptional regulator
MNFEPDKRRFRTTLGAVVSTAHDRRSYAQFCPLARTLDLLGERWTLLIVRELFVGPMRYSDLRGHLPGIGPALLTQRLRDLEAAGFVQRTDLPPPAARTVYELSPRGRELEPVVYEIARFGLPYLDMPTEAQPLPTHLIPTGIKTMVLVEALPRRAFVIHLALDEGDFTMRIAPPAPGPLIARVNVAVGSPDRADAVVRGAVGIAAWVRQGVLSFDDAQAQGVLAVEGEPRATAVVRELFGWA